MDPSNRWKITHVNFRYIRKFREKERIFNKFDKYLERILSLLPEEEKKRD